MTALEIIRTIEGSYNSKELIYEMMVSHFSNLSNITFHTVTIGKGSHIYRARYSDKLKSFETVSEISFPKSELVKDFSRLNRPKQNLFYGSESEIACITEMLPFWFNEFNVGDKILVTIGEWIVNHDLKLLIIPDTTNSSKLNQNLLNNLHPEEILFWNYISEKFRTSTIDDKTIYEFTSAFANVLWLNAKERNVNANGFVYGSVQSKEFLNIAIHPDTINNKLLTPREIVEIQFQKVGISEEGLPTYEDLKDRKRGFANIENSLIEWI